MSTVVQRRYAPEIAPALVGNVATEVPSTTITRICETAAGIPFGVAVSQGAAEKGAIIGGSAFVGITIRDITLIPGVPLDPLADTGPTVDLYGQHFNMGVITKGHIWVLAGSDVAANDNVYFEATGGTLSNSASGTAATGSITFTSQPDPNDVIVIEANATGDTFTFKASGANGTTEVNIGPTLGDTITALAAVLNASAGTHASKLKYQAYPSSPGGAGEGSGANMLLYADKTVGTAGNSITVTTNVGGATVSGSGGALGGGVASATQIVGAKWISSAIGGTLAKVSLGYSF